MPVLFLLNDPNDLKVIKVPNAPPPTKTAPVANKLATGVEYSADNRYSEKQCSTLSLSVRFITVYVAPGLVHVFADKNVFL